jgi:hypothetical protein
VLRSKADGFSVRVPSQDGAVRMIMLFDSERWEEAMAKLAP